MVGWSSIHASTFNLPQQCWQISTSMMNTRFKRWAQLIARRLSAVVLPDCPDLMPRLAGVTSDRNLLLARSGVPAKTAWNRVRFTLGFGISAASFARESTVRTQHGSYHLDKVFLISNLYSRLVSQTSASQISPGG